MSQVSLTQGDVIYSAAPKLQKLFDQVSYLITEDMLPEDLDFKSAVFQLKKHPELIVNPQVLRWLELNLYGSSEQTPYFRNTEFSQEIFWILSIGKLISSKIQALLHDSELHQSAKWQINQLLNSASPFIPNAEVKSLLAELFTISRAEIKGDTSYQIRFALARGYHHLKNPDFISAMQFAPTDESLWSDDRIFMNLWVAMNAPSAGYKLPNEQFKLAWRVLYKVNQKRKENGLSSVLLAEPEL